MNIHSLTLIVVEDFQNDLISLLIFKYEWINFIKKLHFTHNIFKMDSNVINYKYLNPFIKDYQLSIIILYILIIN